MDILKTTNFRIDNKREFKGFNKKVPASVTPDAEKQYRDEKEDRLTDKIKEVHAKLFKDCKCEVCKGIE